MSGAIAREEAAIYQEPVELLQKLIRFDTTNPPGNERACVDYIADILNKAGIETTFLACDPARPNLVARLSGQGNAPPLLLYGHVDVVPTANQVWRCPPFEGKLAEDCVWGRGALDMKGGIAMMLAALLRARAENLAMPGDVLLTVVSDEEAGAANSCGARYLVENHAAVFKGCKYAIGEFGGFTFRVMNRCFYPIMVAEKQSWTIEAKLRGPGGHALSSRVYGGVTARLGSMLAELDRCRLPVHITPVARQMYEMMSSCLPFPAGLVLRQVLNPRLTNRVLKMLGKQGQPMEPLLHNTVCATFAQSGEAGYTIPSEATLILVGGLLPGYSPDDLISELRPILGDEVEFRVLSYEPCPPAPDMKMFDCLSGIIRELDPQGIPIPMLLSAITDARLFARLGIQTYGFLSMKLPQGFDFVELLHGADERIPVEALSFGTEAIFRLLQRFGS